MTDLPPASLDYQSPDSRRSLEWPAVLAWLAIIGCTLFVMIRTAREYKKLTTTGANPTNQMQVDISGRAAVGFKLLAQAGEKENSSFNSIQNLVATMEQNAKSPSEKVRAVIVLAEVVGSGDALNKIADLERSNPSPPLPDDLAALKTIYRGNSASVNPATRQRLIDRYGFFGRLALSFGKPDSDPQRAGVLKEARSAAERLIALGAIAIGLCIIVFIALVVAIILVSLNKIRLAYVPQRWANSAYLEAFAIYLVGFLLLSFGLSHLTKTTVPLAWDWIALIFIPIAMGWIHLRGETIPQARFGLGWYAGKGAPIEIALGVFGYLACAPIVAIGIGISLYLSKQVGVTPTHPVEQMLGGSRWEIVNLFGIACIMAPILEETMFRGALFNHLRRRWSWFVSAPVVAFFFAAIHPQGWTMIPGLGAIAIVLAGIREWRGTAMASIAAHATNNGVVLAFALLATR